MEWIVLSQIVAVLILPRVMIALERRDERRRDAAFKAIPPIPRKKAAK